MNTRELFQSKPNEQLRNWWMQVTTDPRYQQVILYARSQFMETRPTSEYITGAAVLQQILTGLAVVEDNLTDTLAQIAEVARLESPEELLQERRRKKA